MGGTCYARIQYTSGPSSRRSFSGQVTGRTLTLAVAVNDTVEKRVVALGPVTVVYERTANMGTCPICQLPPVTWD